MTFLSVEGNGLSTIIPNFLISHYKIVNDCYKNFAEIFYRLIYIFSSLYYIRDTFVQS